MSSMKNYPLISIICVYTIPKELMVHCIIKLFCFIFEEIEMAYNLFVKMGAAYIGAVAVLTLAVSVLA